MGLILRGFFCLLLATSAFSPTALAHRQKAAVITVSSNPRTDLVEIIHRYYLHDAEHALQEVGGAGFDLHADQQAQADFARYIASRFDLFVDEQRVDLQLLGAEVDGSFIYVYQETSLGDDVASVTVEALALQDVWPDQSNLVNIELDGCVRSAVFTAGVGPKTIELGGACPR